VLVTVHRLIHGELLSVLVHVQEGLPRLSDHPHAGDLAHDANDVLRHPPVHLERPEVDVLGIELQRRPVYLRPERLVRLVGEVAGEVLDPVLRAILELVRPLLGERLRLLRQEGASRYPRGVCPVRPGLSDSLYHMVDGVEPHRHEAVELVRYRAPDVVRQGLHA